MQIAFAGLFTVFIKIRRRQQKFWLHCDSNNDNMCPRDGQVVKTLEISDTVNACK